MWPALARAFCGYVSEAAGSAGDDDHERYWGGILVWGIDVEWVPGIWDVDRLKACQIMRWDNCLLG